MGNKQSTKATEPSLDFEQVLQQSTIEGETWQDLAINLKNHVENKKLIEREWKKLMDKDVEKNGKSELFSASTMVGNKEKNRYVNILPYDISRVKLTIKEGVDGSDYINANYVNTDKRAYICCQAPLESTVEDFHRMIWENNVEVIVMLTKFVEDGRIKATEYLPSVDDDPKKYGDFYVEDVTEEVVNGGVYVKRRFVLKKDTERRNVTQFHYLAWPDHDVPEEPKELIDFIIQVNKIEDDLTKKQPTIVHCSAGIGRTGTYIIINSVLEQLSLAFQNKETKPPAINLMKTIYQIREMRASMVNHISQYYYCYHAIMAHIDRLLDPEADKKAEAKRLEEKKKKEEEKKQEEANPIVKKETVEEANPKEKKDRKERKEKRDKKLLSSKSKQEVKKEEVKKEEPKKEEVKKEEVKEEPKKEDNEKNAKIESKEDVKKEEPLKQDSSSSFGSQKEENEEKKERRGSIPMEPESNESSSTTDSSPSSRSKSTKEKKSKKEKKARSNRPKSEKTESVTKA
eukprot:TRINITY_DN2495_c0_g1_i1.p1 TRINITY_DN2495_c0_g1~~TRINITY_DN2495_c0_g1_i1.p1  ORF type:complete len:515 (-),score=204.29 TRINITY_DN2495_c0_g1_i1:71-1615(-)